MHKCMKLYMQNIHYFIASKEWKFEPLPQMFINKCIVKHLGHIQTVVPKAAIFLMI